MLYAPNSFTWRSWSTHSNTSVQYCFTNSTFVTGISNLSQICWASFQSFSDEQYPVSSELSQLRKKMPCTLKPGRRKNIFVNCCANEGWWNRKKQRFFLIFSDFTFFLQKISWNSRVHSTRYANNHLSDHCIGLEHIILRLALSNGVHRLWCFCLDWT